MSIWVFVSIFCIWYRYLYNWEDHRVDSRNNDYLYSLKYEEIWCTKDKKNPTLLVLWWPTTQNDAKWRLKRCDDNFRQYLCFQYNFFCRSKHKNLLLCVGLFNAMVLYCFIHLVKISGMSYINRICYIYCYIYSWMYSTLNFFLCFHDDAMNNSDT